MTFDTLDSKISCMLMMVRDHVELVLIDSKKPGDSFLNPLLCAMGKAVDLSDYRE